MRALLFTALLALISGAHAAEVGTVTETVGDVRLLRNDAYYQAAPGVDLTPLDVIETGTGASAQLEMADGTILKLGPETRLALSEYRLDDQRNVVQAGLDVLTGWLRFAVAKLTPAGRYTIDSPVMTVGIRGTEGVIQAGTDTGDFALDEGAVDITAPDDVRTQRAHVVAGQFVERHRGQGFLFRPGAPTRFIQGMPVGLRSHLQRRMQMLRRHGVPPQMIRRVMRHDAQRYLREHPHARAPVRKRFERMRGRQGRGEATTWRRARE